MFFGVLLIHASQVRLSWMPNLPKLGKIPGTVCARTAALHCPKGVAGDENANSIEWNQSRRVRSNIRFRSDYGPPQTVLPRRGSCGDLLSSQELTLCCLLTPSISSIVTWALAPKAKWHISRVVKEKPPGYSALAEKGVRTPSWALSTVWGQGCFTLAGANGREEEMPRKCVWEVLLTKRDAVFFQLFHVGEVDWVCWLGTLAGSHLSLFILSYL